MYSILKENDKNYNGYTEFIVDMPNEIDELPTEDIAVGSICIVISTKSVYMLNNERKWVKFG